MFRQKENWLKLRNVYFIHTTLLKCLFQKFRFYCNAIVFWQTPPVHYVTSTVTVQCSTLRHTYLLSFSSKHWFVFASSPNSLSLSIYIVIYEVSNIYVVQCSVFNMPKASQIVLQKQTIHLFQKKREGSKTIKVSYSLIHSLIHVYMLSCSIISCIYEVYFISYKIISGGLRVFRKASRYNLCSTQRLLLTCHHVFYSVSLSFIVRLTKITTYIFLEISI